MTGKYPETTSYLQRNAGNEILIEFEHGKLGGVKHLVTELPIPFDPKDLKVNVTT